MIKSTEASDLALRPGEWPDYLRVDGVAYARGAIHKNEDGGDVTYVEYRSLEGDTLWVYND